MTTMNRGIALALLMAGVLTACANAPKPPQCKGEFRPVNAATMQANRTALQAAAMHCNGGGQHAQHG